MIKMHQKHQETQNILRKHYLELKNTYPGDEIQTNEAQLITNWLRKIAEEHTKHLRTVNNEWIKTLNAMVENEAKQIKFVLDKAASLLRAYYAIMEKIEQNKSEQPKEDFERLQKVFNQMKAHNEIKDKIKMMF